MAPGSVNAAMALLPSLLQDTAVHDIKPVQCLLLPCSLRKTAKCVHTVCQMLVEDHNGIVPQTFEELEKLPGVGHKTASVVICTAFGYVAANSTSDVCKGYHCWEKRTGWLRMSKLQPRIACL